ncbi:MAG: hypothetical protein Q9174_006333 [Haloplaca sp. 1 TL-2023]
MAPSSDDIAHFAAVTGAADSVAAEWLKLFDNDIEKSINAYFDDPEALQKHVSGHARQRSRRGQGLMELEPSEEYECLERGRIPFRPDEQCWTSAE